MKIGVLGTGDVGQTIGTKLISLGHEVKLGSRTADNEKASAWVELTGDKASQGTFADAAEFGDLVFNCSKGSAAVEVIESAGVENFKGKVVIDVSNPIDFSTGTLALTVCNTESMAERIQQTLPDAHVVKAFNTMSCHVMVDPGQMPGPHDVLMAGNDEGAKNQVRELLGTFGWEHFVDLGDITAARGLEAYLLLWFRLYQATGTGMLNIHVTRAG